MVLQQTGYHIQIVFVLCGFECDLLSESSMQMMLDIHRTQMFFQHLCGHEDDHLNLTHLQMSLHTHHIRVATHQCEYDGDHLKLIF